jgi:CBS domain-containing protein
MKVADLIGSRSDVFAITEDTTVYDAARYMREKRVRAVGVLDRQSKLTGVVSQSDISDQVAAENKCPAWTRVSEIMSTDLVTIQLAAALDECLNLMEKHGFYHLLVVDEKGEFCGTISVHDLLKVIATDQKARADMLEAFIFPPR